MTALAFPPASFDLLWCEGAAYIMGVGAALRAWRPLLRPGGRAALSEAVWLRPDPPEPARRLFADYPAMGDVAAARDLVRRSGYRLLGDFVLPQAAWMADYYDAAPPAPRRARAALRGRRGRLRGARGSTPRRSPSSSATASGTAICSW